MSKRTEYRFDIQRKVTRVTGDSATGKSELVRLLIDSQVANSGIAVSCRYKCGVLNNLVFRRISEDIKTVCQKAKKHPL